MADLTNIQKYIIVLLLGMVTGGGAGTLTAGSQLQDVENRVDGLEQSTVRVEERLEAIRKRQQEIYETQKSVRKQQESNTGVLIEIRTILKQRGNETR